MAIPSTDYIFRQCITLRNGKRICKPKGSAFRIPINDDYKPPAKPKKGKPKKAS